MEREWQMFGASILYGMEVVFFYDLIRSIRYTWKHNKILIAVGDMIFWLIIGIFLFSRIYKWNHGIIRWYFLAGILGGMLLYLAKFSNFFLKRLKLFFSWVNIIIYVLKKMICKILGIKNGEDVKEKEEENACQSCEKK